MPLFTTPRSRKKYRAAVMEIDMALINVGEALREDLDTDKEALEIIYEELRDAKERLAKLAKEKD
jgi:hypothetical protein